MTTSIVNIESLDENNKSFGTGFIIDSDEKGVYILTCKHVIDDVKIPMVEEVKARIITINEFIDMAVIYVSKLHHPPLDLQLEHCKSLNVEVIGFSHFSQNLNQKKHIQATLYQEPIELHSTKDDSFYTARKIKANDGYNFDRGNSGSPVICKDSSKVIAMVSNKEGNNIGYAIDIISRKEVWADMPQKLLKKSPSEKSTPKKEEPITVKEVKKPVKVIHQRKSSSLKKYLLYALSTILLSSGTYYYIDYVKEKEHIEQQRKKEKRAKEIEHKGFEALTKRNFSSALQQFEQMEKVIPKFHHVYEIAKEMRKYRTTLNQSATQTKIIKFIINDPGKSPKDLVNKLKNMIKLPIVSQPATNYNRAKVLERLGFKALGNREFLKALNYFKKAKRVYSSLPNIDSIIQLLEISKGTINQPATQRRVLTSIINSSEKPPQEFIEEIKKNMGKQAQKGDFTHVYIGK